MPSLDPHNMEEDSYAKDEDDFDEGDAAITLFSPVTVELICLVNVKESNNHDDAYLFRQCRTRFGVENFAARHISCDNCLFIGKIRPC